MKRTIIAAFIAATTMSSTIAGHARAQEPQPTNDSERAGEKAADSLSMSTKLAIMAGVLAVAGIIVVYEATKSDDDSSTSDNAAIPPAPRSAVTSVLPFDVGGWAAKGEGGVGISGTS
jgi:hypothetical protein